ncbi:hypothetical protein EJ08DRAFT_578833 [Tothia fuscella]|uniref:Fe2OG dioxygenase domain-containing protein n=1 Tax=Tothia fuscella TaxID=1048955 RepID=A0A9P4P2K9_9PEZI|nr:hypothetical protein EJ08DRAFT_578833 [Tothia fuscella]
MDAFVSRKRRRVSPLEDAGKSECTTNNGEDDEDSTDLKLALLASMHPDLDQSTLLEALLLNEGSVKKVLDLLKNDQYATKRKNKLSHGVGYQASLSAFNINPKSGSGNLAKKQLTRKGKTLHLYSPGDIAANTPCSIIHNFLPANLADSLLLELLEEAPTFRKERFQLFDRVVESPHTMCFYVNSHDDVETQKTDYVYNGNRIADVRKSLPEMLKVAEKVQTTVNEEIQKRIREFYPDGKKLLYQSPNEWKPNAAFVNCYDGGQESVGYHTDQLTYLGPRSIIGSLSLGVAREFRIRRIVTQDTKNEDISRPAQKKPKEDSPHADGQGQISIHLPHNSLLVMHAEMQEEWKHSIAPALAIYPHPIAKNKRINITYRHYKDSLHPRFTPRCKCGISTVLRCVQRKKESKGRYMWMCHANYTPGKEGCGFFEWAKFSEDGEPQWGKERIESDD